MCSSARVSIEASHLAKRYPPSRRPWAVLCDALMRRAPGTHGYEALGDISFQIHAGETVGIIGRNGAGKSTLLQLLCGTLQPSAGSVRVLGRVAALLELGAGFSPDFTGRENVYLNAGLHGLDRADIDARFASIAAFAEIGDFMDQPVRTYSSGMFVRLAFAVMAHVDADILIIDEALAVGDAYFTQKCMRYLRHFKTHGTLLFVSHDTTAVMALCDRALWLDGGRIRDQGDAKPVCEHYLASLFASQQRVEASNPATRPSETFHDQRAPWLNCSPLRNDIEVFRFRDDGARFGAGSARVAAVTLRDEHDHALAWMVGGEAVTLAVQVEVKAPMQTPIVGFYVKDRLGQTLFGDNTHLSIRAQPAYPGQTLTARFSFHLPYLPAGDYSIAVAVGDGSQDDHIQHDWVHDALFFRSHCSAVSMGLVGIPMQHIALDADIESPP
ncbi:MAG: ABC transporter ATP-binding protein [Rhodocyclaceae bacterium]